MLSNDKENVPTEPLHNEDVERAPTHGTYLDEDAAAHLSDEHRQYLLQRHGTIELDPLPSLGDADPYNWPLWKVSSDHSRVLNAEMS